MTDLSSIERNLIAAIDGPRMMGQVAAMAQYERHAGTASELESFSVLRTALEESGFTTELLLHDAYISLPGEARLVAGGRDIACNIHSFSRSAPAAGLEGTVVYAGKGRPEDYAGLDVAGNIVLLDGVANPTASLEASRRGAIGQIHISPHEHRHEMCISPVWGSPDDQQVGLLPTTVVVTIALADGEALRAKLQQGPLSATIWGEVDTGWRQTPILIADLPGRDPDKYILLSGHYDSWYLGAMDNGGANATMLEVARLCSTQRAHWQVGLKLAFWSGHSQGRYSSSTWWADAYYEDIRNNCLVHVNVDSTGGKGNTVVADTTAAAELQHLARAVLREQAGQEYSGRRMHRAGDQSFWGIGVPAIFANMSEQPATAGGTNAMATVFGGGTRAGAGTGWWWHTPHDTFDKMDEGILVRDTAIYMSAVWRLLTAPVVPLRFEHAAAEIHATLTALQEAAGDKFSLVGPLQRAEQLGADCSVLSELVAATPASDSARAATLTDCLQRLGHLLVPISYTVAGPYEQDLALGLGPVPCLAPVAELSRLSPDSDAFKHLHVRMMRQRNRVAVALDDALQLVRQTLAQFAAV